MCENKRDDIKKGLISVIVPIYNVEDYLEYCLDSILAQTYSNLEIILIDDGSTDRSSEICDLYAEKDRRITVRHQTNKGISGARNAGIEIFSGEYICFIDSDDYIHPRYVEYLHSLCEKNNCSIAICNYLEVYDNKADSELKNDSLAKIYSGKTLLGEYFGTSHVSIVVPWNKLIRYDVAKDVRFEEGIIYEDEATTFKYIYSAERIAYSDNILYFYRKRKDSITGKRYGIKNLDRLVGFEKRIAFYEEKGEEELVLKEYKYYLSELLITYYKVYYMIDDNTEILKMLKKRYKKAYNRDENRSIPKSRKCLFFICQFFPLIYERRRLLAGKDKNLSAKISKIKKAS
ncbi:glycosyltransferase family 2 protein [Butyrivibrio sp. WCD3002]|uniref:glycosyltransferase family 2 protein n=1 Tax=Butyrivibrio sp. WCD3002 TaxID=1280676 RepID=UPI0004256704|nr:glycosyltransferase [Butyrivibrio sp. WCD3002]